jgi:hypothetical protein
MPHARCRGGKRRRFWVSGRTAAADIACKELAHAGACSASSMSSHKDAADEAGILDRQMLTALSDAKVPTDRFDAPVKDGVAILPSGRKNRHGPYAAVAGHIAHAPLLAGAMAEN